MTLAEEFRSRNFSIYGQWAGVLCIIVCAATGIGNIFLVFTHALILIFTIPCIVFAFVILFIEVPLLLRICPTSEKFDTFIRRFSTNYFRALAYFAMSVFEWLSLIVVSSSLVAAAVFLLIAALCYLLAGVKGQDFVGSKTLGGQGVAQMIV